jgi:hypothetical protein
MKVLNNMTFISILYNKWKLGHFTLIKTPLTLNFWYQSHHQLINQQKLNKTKLWNLK